MYLRNEKTNSVYKRLCGARGGYDNWTATPMRVVSKSPSSLLPQLYSRYNTLRPAFPVCVCVCVCILRLDLPVVQYSHLINNYTSINITKLGRALSDFLALAQTCLLHTKEAPLLSLLLLLPRFSRCARWPGRGENWCGVQGGRKALALRCHAVHTRRVG